MSPQGKTSRPPKSLNKFLKESINAWAEPKRDKRIVLKISADVAYYFKEKEYFPRQKIIKEHKDGSITVESMISNNLEAIHILQQWPSQVIIISPKSLNEYMKKIL